MTSNDVLTSCTVEDQNVNFSWLVLVQSRLKLKKRNSVHNSHDHPALLIQLSEHKITCVETFSGSVDSKPYPGGRVGLQLGVEDLHTGT